MICRTDRSGRLADAQDWASRRETEDRAGFTVFEFLAVASLAAVAVAVAIIFQQASPSSASGAMAEAHKTGVVEPFMKLQVSPDHSRILGVHRNGVLSARKLLAPEALRNLEQPWAEPDWIRSDTVLAVSSDCRRLLTLRKDGGLAVCTLRGAMTGSSAEPSTDSVSLENSGARIEDCQAVFSFNGELVAVLRDYRRNLTVWDVTSGRQIWSETRSDEQTAFSRMAFARNDSCFVVGSMSSEITGFDPRSGVKKWTIQRDGTRPSSIDISRDGARLCLGYLRSELALEVVDVATGQVCWCDEQECGGTRIAKFVADDSLVMSCGQYGPVLVRDASSGTELGELWGHGRAVCDITGAGTDETVFTVDHSGPIRTWDLSGFVAEVRSMKSAGLTISQ